jgi:hypothetical protein
MNEEKNSNGKKRKRNNDDAISKQPNANNKVQPQKFVAKPDKVQKTAVLDDDAFRDSRGVSGRRKKVDGLNVYSEEELNLHLNLTGGGTPLCPFDCQCEFDSLIDIAGGC